MEEKTSNLNHTLLPIKGINREIARITDMEALIVTMESQLKGYKEQRDEVIEQIRLRMVEAGHKKIEMEHLTITRVLASTRITFDSKRFQTEHPDTYNQYTKESTTKESVRIKINPINQLK